MQAYFSNLNYSCTCNLFRTIKFNIAKSQSEIAVMFCQYCNLDWKCGFWEAYFLYTENTCRSIFYVCKTCVHICLTWCHLSLMSSI